MSTCAWVVGVGGMLGRSVRRSLEVRRTALFVAPRPFDWNDLRALPAQIEEAARRFADASASCNRWEIYWAAGVGTMASTEADMLAEGVALRALLDAVRTDRRLRDLPGAFVLASSAGGIHGGSNVSQITEQTPPAPGSAYGRTKLAQEQLVHEAFEGAARQAVLVARLSSLYGIDQSSTKPQGLLTHIARSIVRNRVVHMYVPYDTQRDYLAADDAAEALVGATAALPAGAALTRLVAAQRSVTIAEIVAAFRKVAHKPPRVVTSASPLSSLYARSVSFRSVHPGLHAESPRRPLLVGVSQLLQAERARHAAGRT